MGDRAIIKETLYLKKYSLAMFKRVYLLKYDLQNKNIFEKNELLIMELETLIKLNKTTKKVEENEKKIFDELCQARWLYL